jgi:hypothetical protein
MGKVKQTVSYCHVQPHTGICGACWRLIALVIAFTTVAAALATFAATEVRAGYSPVDVREAMLGAEDLEFALKHHEVTAAVAQEQIANHRVTPADAEILLAHHLITAAVAQQLIGSDTAQPTQPTASAAVLEGVQQAGAAPVVTAEAIDTQSVQLSIAPLVFAAFLISVTALLRIKQTVSGDAAFKLMGLSVVIAAGLYLIAAGWGKDQITPITGLLGTSLGFIFGKSFADQPSEGSLQAAPAAPKVD